MQRDGTVVWTTPILEYQPVLTSQDYAVLARLRDQARADIASRTTNLPDAAQPAPVGKPSPTRSCSKSGTTQAIQGTDTPTGRPGPSAFRTCAPHAPARAIPSRGHDSTCPGQSASRGDGTRPAR